MHKLPSAGILIFLAVLFIASGQSVFAQEEANVNEMAAGLGVEWNMNSRENFAGAVVFSYDYSLTPITFIEGGSYMLNFAAGINAAMSSNFSNTTVIETAAFFRWYFLGAGFRGPFAQGELGFSHINEDDISFESFMGGLRAGLRVPLGSFYIEPFGRFGYPYVFGIGAIAGIKF